MRRVAELLSRPQDLGKIMLPKALYDDLAAGMAVMQGGEHVRLEEFYAPVEDIPLGGTIRDIERRAMEQISQEVEAACKKAIAKGEGWRVWRSDIEARRDQRTMGHALHYQILLLEPGAQAPGSGMIYGPWPECDATNG